MKHTLRFNGLNKSFRQFVAALLTTISLILASQTAKAQEGDILDLLPAIITAAMEAKSCDDGVFSTCFSRAGCRNIGGLFEDNMCLVKPEAHALAEQLAGRWQGLTSLDNGTFYNHLNLSLNSLASLNGNSAYALSGTSHISGGFDNSTVNPIVASYDSGEDDWYILDFWGTDIGEISILEVAQTRENQFDGCEFFLNHPDLTYKDGVCNRVRLQRSGTKPSFAATISNTIADLGNYISDLVSSAQGTALDSRVAEKRPSITKIRGLLALQTPEREPIVILSPQDQSSTNGSIVEVTGTVEENINLDRVELQNQRVFPSSNGFQQNIEIGDGSTIITASANYGRRTYTAEVAIETDTLQPTVVAAASTSSTSVVIQFSEPMSDASAASTGNFNIVRNDNNSTLPVTAVQFVDESRTSILVATGLQSDIDYTITAVNVRDRAGNTISGPIPEVEADLSKALFVGTAPSGNEVVDTDGDGILDHIELDGWPVVIVRTDGSSETIIVTSDPFSEDTDNDGISDAEERHGGMNPRNNDSDGDTLLDYDEWNIIYSNPVDQDSDNDGIQDGFEYLFFKTSPILADTDGDQIDDPTELAAGNRNPLIADLPSPDISIGNVNLQLDTRFTFTNEAGEIDTRSKTVEATLTQSENDSFSTSNEASTKNTLKFSEELAINISKEVEAGVPPSAKVSASITATVGSEQGSENGSTNSFGEESSRGSEEAYHDSLTLDVARDTRESISREVLGASMKVDLKIANGGDIPFTVSNLELTAQVQDPRDRRRLIPVASLTPENGTLESINIGVLGDTDRGPFVFNSESVFPQEIQELMKNPRGILIQLANYDIVDEQGNNFAFSSQQVLDRTAGITFDLGDGRVESYRVATASKHDENTGEPTGISMARALEIIGLNRYATIRDGGNGIAESFAGGDDEQVVSPSQTVTNVTTEPKTIIVSVGADGIIDPATIISGDDVLVPADYITESYTSSESIIDGGNGVAETVADGSTDDEALEANGASVKPGDLLIRAGADGLITTVPAGDDIKVPGGAESDVLVRYRDVEASDTEFKFWTLYSPNDLRGVDLDNFQLRSGQQYDFAFVQDRDLDGVWAREEYLYGTSDFSTNSDGCDPAVPLVDQAPCDSISDFNEIRTGWRVQLKSSPQSYRVYPNPNQGDSDRDGILDDVERACGLDPRQRDTDFDGLSDYEEIFGVRVSGTDESDMVSANLNDASNSPIRITRYLGAAPAPQALPFEPYTPLLEADFFEHTLSAACIAVIGVEGYATDPLDEDTDGDFINDLNELNLGLHPNDKSDGASFLDDDGDGLPNGFESKPRDIMINGGTIVSVTSSPNKTDSDDDKLPDLLEYYLGSDPSNPDTDGDGILDTDEYRNLGAVCVGDPPAISNPPTACATFLNKPAEDYNAFVSACNEANVCDVASIEGAGTFGLANERQLGTNLNHFDTDGDGHMDSDEINPGTRHLNNLDPSSGVIATGYSDISNPFDPDSDDDGLLDGAETYTYQSNPANAFTDTDDMVLNDGQEVDEGRDPSFNDKKVTIRALSMYGSISSPTAFVSVNSIITNGLSPITGCTAVAAGTSFNVGYSSACHVTQIVREGNDQLTLRVLGTLYSIEILTNTPIPIASCDSALAVTYNNATGANLTSGSCSFGPRDNAPRTMNVVFGVDLNLN